MRRVDETVGVTGVFAFTTEARREARRVRDDIVMLLIVVFSLRGIGIDAGFLFPEIWGVILSTRLALLSLFSFVGFNFPKLWLRLR